MQRNTRNSQPNAVPTWSELGIDTFRMNSSVLYSIFKCRFIPNTEEYLPVLRADSNKI
jgi:hypothetical protein